jgi:hypothetical protein
MSDHLGRDEKDFAIEFGEYLAKAAERFQDSMQDELAGRHDEQLRTERWRALDSAIYEFRKRAQRATQA